MTRMWVIAGLALALAGCGESEGGTESVAEIGAETETETETETGAEDEAGEGDGSGGAEGPPPEIARPYDEEADAQAQIDAAVARSREDGKRVLLMFGANWCPWCRRLDWVFQNEPRVSGALGEGYHLVHVDVGERGSDTNREVARRYGDPLSQGLPCLVVLDGEGAVEHVQETGSLESGDRHDPARVLAFLARWRPAGG